MSFVLVLLLAIPSTADEPVDNFAKEFGKVKTESGRLQVCIDAINAGAIRIGGSVSNIDKIFYFPKKVTHIANPHSRGPQDYFGIRPDFVFFALNKERIRGQFKAITPSCWYIKFLYDNRTGVIYDYGITNAHTLTTQKLTRKSLNEFIDAYGAASDESAKLKVLIDAINAKLIKQGEPVQNISRFCTLRMNPNMHQ